MGRLRNDDIPWGWLNHMVERAQAEGASFSYSVRSELEELPPTDSGWARYRDTGFRTLTVKVG